MESSGQEGRAPPLASLSKPPRSVPQGVVDRS
jgi:hypothetical protein